MAKPQSDKATKTQSDSRGRLTVHLDTEWIKCVDLMAITRQSNLSDFILGLIQNHLATMPRSESEPIRSLVKIATGKALRLDRSSGQSAPEQAQVDSGQGSGSDKLADRLADIQSRAVDAPISGALASLYGN